ncbi:MAG TPA: MFS transporter [bacterium]|nr:MFS transporter [bacterium]
MSLAPPHEASQIGETRTAPTIDRPRLLGISLAHFLNDFHLAWLAPLLPLLVVRFNLSLALAGLLGTILTTSSALSQPVFAFAADRLRRSVLAAVGPVMTVAAMSLVGILPTYGTLMAALLVAAAGTAIFHPQGAAAAGFHSGERLATGLSIFVAAGELAFALGPLYVSAVVQWQGLAWTGVAGLPGLLLALPLALTALRWPTATPGHRGALWRALAAQGRMLFLLWVFVVMRSIVSIGFLTFLPLLLTREQGASLVQGGTAVFLFGGIGAAGGVMGGVLADRIGRRSVLGLSFGLSAPLLALFLVLPSVWRMGLLPLAGITLYLSAPVTIVMAQEGLPQHASLASSIVMGLAWGIGGLSLTPLGAIADVIGLRAALLSILTLAVVGLAAVAALPKQR